MTSGAGLFIAFEGGEGGGKSTQAKLLADWLDQLGLSVELTREPGGTPVGAQIRSILLDPQTGSLSPRTEALLYAADKAEHVDTVIAPALQRGQIVVCDRYIDSTLAYQGDGRTIGRDALEPVVAWATCQLKPNLTIVLDVDPLEGLTRLRGRDRIESEPLDFHHRVRQSFLAFAAGDQNRYLVIDALRPPDEVHQLVRAGVEPLLAGLPA